MTAFNRGDVVLVAFPFTDLTTAKVRPALVVSSDSFNRAGLDVILVGITSQIMGKTQPTDILLTTEDQKCACLPKASLVRLGKIVTLDGRLIHKKLGTLPVTTLARMTSVLHNALSSGDTYGSQMVIQESCAAYQIHPFVRRKKTATNGKTRVGKRKRG